MSFIKLTSEMLFKEDAARKEIKEVQDFVFLVENYEVTTVEQIPITILFIDDSK